MAAPYSERREFVDKHPYAVGITGAATIVALGAALLILSMGTAAGHLFGTMPLIVVTIAAGTAFLGVCHLAYEWHHRP